MKIYIGARFDRREEMRAYAEELQALGHEVVSSWLFREPEFDDRVPLTEQDPFTLRYVAYQDLCDVGQAGLLILFGEVHHGRGGRWVEMGAALANSARVAVVGPCENLFCWAPGTYRVPDWPACLRLVAAMTGYRRELDGRGMGRDR